MLRYSMMAACLILMVWVPGIPDVSAQNPDPSAVSGEAAPCPECPECPDPALVVLRGLEEKKLEIEARAQALDQERKELQRYEAQIDEKLAALTALQAQIEADIARMEEKKTEQERIQDQEHEAKLARLVKMYSGMKPKDAAGIVNEMDLNVAREIFLRMRETSASQILAFVSAEKAAKISEHLAFRPESPE